MRIGFIGSSLAHKLTPLGIYLFVLSQHDLDDETSTSQLVASLQDQVEYLRSELDTRNEELRRKDHLLAAALERIPAIEAPADDSSEPQESAVNDSKDSGKGAAAVPQETGEGEIRKSWWRKFFGF